VKSLCATLIPFILIAPAFASPTVNSPTNGETVNSPFELSASAATCSSRTVKTLGWSLDHSSDTTLIHQQTIDVQINASAGKHTVHVKAWAGSYVCVTDVVVNVTSDGSSSGGDEASGGSGTSGGEATGTGGVTSPLLPPDPVTVSSVEKLSNWNGKHDSGTSGSATGKTSLVVSPSVSGNSRQFAVSYTNKGGERFSSAFAEDRTSKNFLYDAWVYPTDSAKNVANLEMDLNATMPNGQTVIFGFQCSGYSGTWEYSENLGTPQHPKGQWAATKAPCNVANWTPNIWHHVQVSYSRDDSGKATYKAVYFDGVKSDINVTVLAARAMGWGSSIVTNFQIDGRGASGSATLYLDNLVVYRW
jgi:hypothetical protein